ncbi:MAG: efflux RND transporter periplasmic adaptor subunit [Bryobacteraceae bacterium]|nr:efflux RND transporter periplasmic adaptor subunit [Bryobacteraceae bacterium]
MSDIPSGKARYINWLPLTRTRDWRTFTMKSHSTVTDAILVGLLVILPSCSSKPGAKSKQEALTEAVGPGAWPSKIQLAPDSPQLKRIHVDVVREQRIASEETHAPAAVEVDPGRSSPVMLLHTGRIVDIPVRFGGPVARGQPVLYVESSEAEGALAAEVEARAALAQARAANFEAEAAYERYNDLFRRGAAAKKDLLVAEAKLGQADAALAQAEIVALKAKSRLDILGLDPKESHRRIAVRSPIAGNVTEVNAVAGEFRNDLSSPAMTIADLTSVWIAFAVPENELRLINRGDLFQVDLDAFPNHPLQATVTRISDVVDLAARTIKVYAEMENPKRDFRPQMLGRVRHLGRANLMPTVPAAALVEAGGHSYVYRQTGPGRFEQTPIEVVGRAGRYVGISKGVRSADRVVADGAMLLRPK